MSELEKLLRLLKEHLAPVDFCFLPPLLFHFLLTTALLVSLVLEHKKSLEELPWWFSG